MKARFASRSDIIFQGEDRTFTVTTSEDLSSAAEIEYRIDTSPQVAKTKTGGGITNVTSAGFDVTITAGDTENITAGTYVVQCRYTDGSNNTINGRFKPNKVEIRENIFVNPNPSSTDYGNRWN